MKKKPSKPSAKAMRPEYDFSGGIRGKYAAGYAKGTNLVKLAPDVAKLFPTEESVNAALRACGEIVKAQRRKRA